MRIRLRWLVMAALLLTGVWYLYTPRRAWDRFMRGIVLAQPKDMDATIDFDALRDNLRQDLRAALQRNGSSDLVLRASGALLDQLVAQTVTPRGLTSLVTAFGTRTPQAADRDSLDAITVTTFHYRGPSTVDVRIRPASADAQGAGVFTFTRSGLRWRLTRVWSDRLARLGDPS
jgi:hypothetical protein